MRNIGLHIRVNDSLSAAAQKALRLKLPFFQCFLLSQTTGKLLDLQDDDVTQFLTLRRQHFNQLFMHGSYWINLASLNNVGHNIFKRELALAQKLEFSHIIVHPGSPGGGSKAHGIAATARILNSVVKDVNITIVLENAAHGKKTIGGDLHDFKQLRALLDAPEKIKFCIATAHAFVYGYDITTPQGREQFIALLQDTVGIENIVLLHVNDAFGNCGSRIDRHAVPGQGTIGIAALQSFVNDVRLQHLPLLLELPELPEQDEENILALVRTW